MIDTGAQITDQLKGVAELSAKLSKLGRAVGGKILRSSAMSAALPALRAVQAAAPVGSFQYSETRSDNGTRRMVDPYPVRGWKGRYRAPGFLKSSLRRKAMVSRSGNTVVVLIGPTLDGFYSRWTEFGKSTYPKKPWLEPAFESQIDAMQQRLADTLRKQIEKIAKEGK